MYASVRICMYVCMYVREGGKREEKERERELVTAQPKGCQLTGFTRASHPEDPSPRRGKPLRHEIQAPRLQALDAKERERESGRCERASERASERSIDRSRDQASNQHHIQTLHIILHASHNKYIFTYITYTHVHIYIYIYTCVAWSERSIKQALNITYKHYIHASEQQGEQAGRQAGRQGAQRASGQASKHASKISNEQASKRASKQVKQASE